MLARHVITADGVMGMSVVSVRDDGTVCVEAFEHETPNTIWNNSSIALLQPEALTEFLLDDIERMMSHGDTLDRIHAYLNASSLLAVAGDRAVALSFSEL